MPIEKQSVSINLGGGIDTKSDPKQTVASKAILLQDSIFTNTKRWTKRNGYDAMPLNIIGGGSISNPKMVKAYKDELVCAGSGSNGERIFGYSSVLSGWADRGKYKSIQVSKKNISSPSVILDGFIGGSPQLGIFNSSSATASGITIYSYDGYFAKNTFSTYITVTDNSNGTNLVEGLQIVSALGASIGFSRMILLGPSTFAILYVGDSAQTQAPSTSARLCLRIISVSLGSGVVVGSEIVIGTPLAQTGSATSPGFYYCYDAIQTLSGAFLALSNISGPSLDLYTISTAGSVSGPTHVTTAGASTPISITLDPSGANAWVYWVDNGSTLKYAIYNSSTRAQVLAPTSAQTSLSLIHQVCAIANSSSSQTLFISQYTDPAATGTYTIGIIYPIITTQTVSSSGSLGSVTVWLSGADIYSKPISINGRNYMACVTLSNFQSTGFIFDLSIDPGQQFPTAVSKFLALRAEGIYNPGSNTTGSGHVAPNILAVRYPGFLNQLYSPSSGVYNLTCGFVVSDSTQVLSSTTASAAYASENLGSVNMGACDISFNFSSIDAFQSLVQQDLLILNGGIVEQYDGSYISELGFSTDPDSLTFLAEPGASGGIIPAGTYQFYVLYSWTDSSGNINQSAPSQPYTVVLGSTGSILIGFAPLTITQKQNVLVSIYKTTDGGTVPFLIYTAPNPTTWSFFLDQGTNDDILSSFPALYTEGGAILDNIAPPPSMILWTNNNRLWAIDSEDPESSIQYSKTASEGTGISFSTGELEVIIDSKNGPITGASPMDEKTVILKQSGLGYFIGDGANDAGTGSSITNFQFIPSDVGCSNSKSVKLYPGGIIFRTDKGVYQVNRGVQVGYFGSDVEAYNSQNILAAEIISNKNQIRFLTSSGSSLLFDYFMNQWSVFTNHQGLSSTIWNGNYIYARADGLIFAENASTFLDNGASFAPFAQSAWIKASQVQNFQRIKMFELLGDYQGVGGHGVQISVAYDWNSNFTATDAYIFDGSTSFYQYRAFSPQQKCDAFQLIIQEITTGASGEFIDFTDLGVEIGLKKGLNKLSAARSAG